MTEMFIEQNPIEIAIQGLTDPGRQRTENQDNFLVADLGVNPEENGVGTLLSPAADDEAATGLARVPLGPKGVLIVVADGMGGAAAGSVASKMATGWIHEELVARWTANRDNTARTFMSDLRSAIEATNAMVHQQSGRYPQYRGMGTTVTAAGILGGYLLLAHVGDSRAYLVRGGEATQLTRDQSLVQELIDSGALSEADAETSQHRNVILQALGVLPQVKVDLTYQELRRGDTVVLCSDGLFRTVQREEIGAAAGADRLDDVCQRLVSLANERGGPDNVTVVVARIDGPGAPPPGPEDRVERRPYDL